MQCGLASQEKAIRLSICLLVCPSACLSVKRVICENEIKLCAYSYATWKIIHPSFLIEECLVGATRSPEILGQADPVGAKTPIFSRYSLEAPRP